MRKYFYILVAFFTIFYTRITNAQGGILDGLDTTAGQAGYTVGSGDPIKTLPNIIGNTLRGLIGLLGVIFMILIIYGGVMWMTAAGNEEKVAKAKKIISQATIGLAVIVVAYAITEMIFTILIDASPPADEVTQIDEP